VGWAIVVGCPKRQFQIANLLEVDFKLEFKKNILLVVMFQNVFIDFKILKNKQIFSSFNVFWNLCVIVIFF